MRNGKSKLVMILVVALALVIVFPLTIILMNRPQIPAVTLPSPNAYDTLTEAGSMVGLIPMDYAETEDLGKLRTFVEANAEALSLVNAAVDQQCVVPIDYEGKMADVVDTAQPIRQAMRLLHVKARIAELEDDAASAASLYAQMFALSSKSANGGFTVHTLVAAAHERVALNKLKELAGDLTGEQKREVSEQLMAANRQPRNMDEIIEREHVLVKKEHGTLSGTWMIRASRTLAQPATRAAADVDAQIVKLYEEVLELLAE